MHGSSESSDGRPIACVDVNGVLDQYTGWRGAEHWDEPRPGAAEFLRSLNERGFRVVIHTTRWPEDVRSWLRAHGLLEYVADVTDRKVAAFVFVDDRAITFRGDFDETLREIESFRAHWES